MTLTAVEQVDCNNPHILHRKPLRMVLHRPEKTQMRHKINIYKELHSLLNKILAQSNKTRGLTIQSYHDKNAMMCIDVTRDCVSFIQDSAYYIYEV